MPHPDVSWPSVLTALVTGIDLTPAQGRWAMEQIITGSATDAQIGGFATALRAKGESAAEVAILSDVMLEHAAPLPGLGTLRVVDVVGTGGDRAGTVNISTMAAMVVAACGVPVVKHGNRAASSACGSADLLEALGVTLSPGAADVARSVAEIGIGFCFAAAFHPGMRYAAGARRELGVPTVFNFLGPLTNPARPQAGVIGCADPDKAPLLARVVARRGMDALVVRGDDGLDEFTTTAPTKVWVVSGGQVSEQTIDAVDLGLPRVEVAALRGGDAQVNAAVAREVFGGKTGPVADVVALTAAAALVTYDGIGDDLMGALHAGLERARVALESGDVERILNRWVARS